MAVFESLEMLIASLIALTLGIIYLHVKTIYKYFEQRGIPYDKPTFPFGSFTGAFKKSKSLAYIYADIYGKNMHHKMVGLFSFWKRQVLIRDPEIIKSVLVKDFDIFQDRGTYYNKKKDPLTAHLFTLDGDAWKFLRAKLSPTFTSGKIKGMHPNIIECTKLMMDFIAKCSSPQKPLEFQSLFIKFGLDVISTTAFGLNCESLTDVNSKFVEMARRVVEPKLMRFLGLLLMLNGQVGRMLDIPLLPKDVSDFFLGVFRDAVKFRLTNQIIRNDYLQLLMDLKNAGSEGSSFNLKEEDLAAQAFVFIVAGSETTSATMSCCLYELSRNYEIQARLHQELDALSDLSFENVNNCQYLDMVVSETLRKYPPLGFLNRECSQDYRIPNSDFVIEKGTVIVISLQGLQNDPDLFPNPELFNPERFSRKNKNNIQSYSYMPFGDGPRYCIGKRFAKIVVKTGLAILLRRYEVCHSHSASETVPLHMEPHSFISFVADGMWLQLKDRADKK